MITIQYSVPRTKGQRQLDQVLSGMGEPLRNSGMCPLPSCLINKLHAAAPEASSAASSAKAPLLWMLPATAGW